MYRYDEIDQRLVDERVAQFRDQTRRFLAGELAEDDFRPLRLRNGLYIQRLAPMLRIAIPYGLLSSTQLRKLSWIARTYDRASRTYPRSLPSSPRCRCTPSRPRATASATSPPTTSRAWRQTRSSTHSY